MITKLSSHQITFLPYIGFWKKMYQSDFMDLTCLYDQFDKGAYSHRVKIGTDSNNRWLTLPVGNKNLHRPCVDIELNNELLFNLYNILEGWYRDYPNWEVYSPYLKEVFTEYEYQYYWEINFKLILWIRDLLEIDTILAIAPRKSGDATDKLVDRVKKYNGSVYLSGEGGRNYLDESKFLENGIELEYVKNNTKEEDLSTVSILSYIMKYSIDEVKEFISDN